MVGNECRRKRKPRSNDGVVLEDGALMAEEEEGEEPRRTGGRRRALAGGRVGLGMCEAAVEGRGEDTDEIVNSEGRVRGREDQRGHLWANARAIFRY